MENLSKSFARFQRRAALLTILATSLLSASIFITLTIAVLWIDSIVPLSSASRWGISRVGLLAIAVVLTFLVCTRIRAWNSRRMAFLIDERGATGGSIATGWDLNNSLDNGKTRIAPNQQTTLFAMNAIRSAMGRLEGYTPSQILSWRELHRPGIALAILGVLATVMTLIAPGYMWHQWRRIAYPHLDIPPYSDLLLYLDEKELSVKYGDDIKILASSSKKPRERLELVTQLANGREYILPMLSRGPTQWQAMLTNVHDSMVFFVRSGSAVSERGKLSVQLTPEIKATRVQVTPPAYARKAAYDGPIPDNGISGLVGTEVVLTIESNRDLRAGTIQFAFADKSEASLQMLPSTTLVNTLSSRSVSAVFTLNREASLEAHVLDVDELVSTEVVQSRLRIIQDRKPSVRIVDPKPVSLATPDIELPIVIAAEDDFGIASLKLYRSLNGSPATADDIPTDGAARVDATVSLSLPTYDLLPGDEIVLFARVEDNDPSGAKGFETKATMIKIISVREFQEIMLEQQGVDALQAKYDAAQRYLEKLSMALAAVEDAARKAEENPDEPQTAKDLKQKLEAAERAANEAAKEIEKLANIESDIEVDQQLSQMLKEMASETADAAGLLDSMSEKQNGERPLTQQEKEQLNSIQKKNQSNRKDIQEEAIDSLEQLEQFMQLELDEEHFESLAENQRAISERMKSLQSEKVNDASTERRMAEMEAEQEELRQQLRDLSQSIREHAEKLPNDAESQNLKQSALDFSRALQESQAEPFMRSAQRSLLDSKSEQASEQAASAAEELEDLMEQGNSMQEANEQSVGKTFKPGRAGFDPKKALDQMKQKFGRGKARSSQLGDGKGGQSGSGGDAQSSNEGQRSGSSQRSPSQPNTGLYGSMPKPSASSQGRSDRTSQGTATNSASSKQDQGKISRSMESESDAAGQGLPYIPPQYRNRVSEYMQRILEKPNSR